MRSDLAGSRLVRAVALTVAVALPLAGCGSKPPTGPGPGTTVTISSVTPSSLSTTGGVTVTISGIGFGTDSVVTVDGVTVTGATVTASSITLMSPTHAAGQANLVVITGGKSASSTLMFVAPSGANQPPTISSIRSVGTRANQASGFGDIGETVTLLATVTDLDTAAASLTFVWTASQGGSITGSGAAATWTLPASLATTPSTVNATLIVMELYTENGVVQHNSSTRTFAMSVHDSQKEILDLGQVFLDRFSQSNIPAAAVVSNFSQTCDGGQGYIDELGDVEFHREHYLMLSGWSNTKVPPVTFNFGGRCSLRNRRADACSRFSVHWPDELTKIDPRDPTRPVGSHGETHGIDYVTAVLENDRWRLCHSDYIANELPAFMTGYAKSLYLRKGGRFDSVSKSPIKK